MASAFERSVQPDAHDLQRQTLVDYPRTESEAIGVVVLAPQAGRLLVPAERRAYARHSIGDDRFAVARTTEDDTAMALTTTDRLCRRAAVVGIVAALVAEAAVVDGFVAQLLERAGTGATGSVTGIYTVLVDGDDHNEPIADAARSILDGHVVLDRKLAVQGHFPSVDAIASISRVASRVTSAEQRRTATALRAVLGTSLTGILTIRTT